MGENEYFDSAKEVKDYLEDQWPKISELGPPLGFHPVIPAIVLERQNHYRFEVLRSALTAALFRIDQLEAKLAEQD